jgi:hypothetical protein
MTAIRPIKTRHVFKRKTKPYSAACTDQKRIYTLFELAN